jgi:hypothetical protein
LFSFHQVIVCIHQLLSTAGGYKKRRVVARVVFEATDDD